MPDHEFFHKSVESVESVAFLYLAQLPHFERQNPLFMRVSATFQSLCFGSYSNLIESKHVVGAVSHEPFLHSSLCCVNRKFETELVTFSDRKHADVENTRLANLRIEKTVKIPISMRKLG